MTDIIEDRLTALGHALPQTVPPRGTFLPGRVSGNLLFLSGQICEWEGQVTHHGPVGEGFDFDAGQAAARICALNLLYNIRAVAGTLDRVTQVIRLGGFVAAPPDFGEGPRIVNGASQLFIALWGDAGQHARTAVNVSSLPARALVEIEAIVELRG